ncbi:MAG TPA: hypothetical protein VFU28_03545 [Vicinamibacterales bacterium]|nr:hypothetical protein [Vicinamibacterales bacterium]
MRAQQLAEQGSVAAPGILAIAANRKIRLLAERTEQRNRALGIGTCHLAQVSFRERGPAGIGPWLRLGIRNQLAGWRDLRQPHVEEIELRVILFPDATRQQSHRADPNPFTACSRRAKAYDLNHL